MESTWINQLISPAQCYLLEKANYECMANKILLKTLLEQDKHGADFNEIHEKYISFFAEREILFYLIIRQSSNVCSNDVETYEIDFETRILRIKVRKA